MKLRRKEAAITWQKPMLSHAQTSAKAVVLARM